jgi:phosphatidylserine/phosphatidylglycerophosphate/cardiolipin synthase-like enzyme
VQSLRTVPPAKYKFFSGADETNPPISFAPDGLFEFRTALKKAITNAKTYIYIEDQAFISQEVFKWIAEAIKKEPKLSVILLTSGAADPTDRESPPEFLTNAINRGLFDLLTKEEQKNQIRMFKRFGDWLPFVRQNEGEPPKPVILNVTEVIEGTSTSIVKAPTTAPAGEYPLLTPVRLQTGVDTFKIVGKKGKIENGFEIFVVENLPGGIPPQPAVYQIFAKVGIIIHSKTTLVDDYWAVIGSGNIMRRSLYTDLEHGISIIDGQSVETGKPAFVKEYRKKLWNDQFRHNNVEDFDEIQAALHAWDSSWGREGNALSRPDWLELVPLPITPDIPLEGKNRRIYDAIQDVDARDEWTLDGVM